MEHSVDIGAFRLQLMAYFKKRSERDSSLGITKEVMKFIRQIVVHGKYENISDLIELLKTNAQFLSAFNPSELVIKNAFLLVQKLVRDEDLKLSGGDDSQQRHGSLGKLWRNEKENGRVNLQSAVHGKKLKREVIEAVKEIISEVGSSRESVAERAAELVQLRETILVYSMESSPTMKKFLSFAKTRNPQILSVTPSLDIDSAPKLVIPIEFCDVAEKMKKTTNVFLPSVAVFPDGSCLVPSGGLSICLTAQLYSVPVYILASFYKITPYFVPDVDMINPQTAPGIPFSLARQFTGRVQIVNPSFDLIPAALVSMFITNSSTFDPSHVYRIISEYYHPDDVNIS